MKYDMELRDLFLMQKIGQIKNKSQKNFLIMMYKSRNLISEIHSV